jgi:hypothetical protein
VNVPQWPYSPRIEGVGNGAGHLRRSVESASANLAIGPEGRRTALPILRLTGKEEGAERSLLNEKIGLRVPIDGRRAV